MVKIIFLNNFIPIHNLNKEKRIFEKFFVHYIHYTKINLKITQYSILVI